MCNLLYYRPLISHGNSFSTCSVCFKHSKHNKGSKNRKKELSSIVQAVSIKPCVDPDGINVGEELSGSLNRGAPLLCVLCRLICKYLKCA